MIIAVDGPVAAGKGTLARSLATRLNLAYLDTGSLYRIVAAKVLEAGGDPADPAAAEAAARTVNATDLDRADLRREDVGQAASIVSALPSVRDALLAYQRNFAETPPDSASGAVLDGRDIGTVVCREADVKLFVTASVEHRAQRRHNELLERGEESIYARVLQDLQERDKRDSRRKVAPLRPADDAVILDSSEMTADQVLERALEIVSRKLNSKEG